MPNISASFIAIGSTELTLSKQGMKAGSGSFDALLFDADVSLNAKKFAGTLVEKITQSMNQSLDAVFSKSATKNAFPFSSAFEDTFGSTGPLIDFINEVTSKLGLSAQQNQALQDIAVRHKDTTRAPADVQKIAAELKQAGIV